MSESARNKSPTVYVIAGPNGAGKTTFAAEKPVPSVSATM